MANPLVTLANMFSSAPVAAPVQVVAPITALSPVPTPGNIPPNPAISAVPGNPTSPAVPVVATEPKSALDNFATLWDTDPNRKVTPPTPLLNVDSKAIAEAAAKIDFRAAITPEIQARMKAGGDDGMNAMLEVMNGMAQTVFAKSAEASALMSMETVSKARKQLQSDIPRMVKSSNLRSSLQENPVLSHPAISPMVSNIAAQLQVKHPNATESQLTEMANEIFVGLAEMVTKQAKSNDPKSKLETDDKKASDFSDW